ncbi:MAG: paraquat-inducible protein A [Kiloniellales bacterium]|nr:paraquat-inducible protein A [Kiloniellales bacterium]
MTAAPMTATARALLSCDSCALLSQAVPVPAGAKRVCPRCGSALEQRKANSLSRTWALVLAAYILYVPANLLPVMTVISFGKGEADTIMSGVRALIAGGDWPIALLVFLASVTIPVAKLFALTFLLVSVHLKSRWRPKDRTFLYRCIEFIGRWSMIDIFVISILVALIKLENVATIEAGFGAVCFAGVVIITIFAAVSFDPRLIWDSLEEVEDHE